MMIRYSLLVLLLGIICAGYPDAASAQPYADQHYVLNGADTLWQDAEATLNVQLSADGKRIELTDGSLAGYIIVKAQQARELFDRALPSWNGQAPHDEAAFKVFIRVPSGDDWSPWLTVGFWKNNLWSSYGSTDYSGGEVAIDYLKLNHYTDRWQFKVILKRSSEEVPSPSIHQLSLFVSDSRTTDQVSISELVDDSPEAIFIPTDFYYQYELDPVIGPSICSPTTVSMIIRSFDIDVDPVPFARATKDPYWGIFGVWPRVVQHASEYGLNGTVTRYRSWSEVRRVLANDGRVALSIGQPLYAGHLVMLAGFDAYGDPIVHDPAKSNGYSYMHSKYSLSRAWFDKGGIAYTFYEPDNPMVTGLPEVTASATPRGLEVYPVPVRHQARVRFQMTTAGQVTIRLLNMAGRVQKVLHQGYFGAGSQVWQWSKNSQLAGGVYVLQVQSPDGMQQQRVVVR